VWSSACSCDVPYSGCGVVLEAVLYLIVGVSSACSCVLFVLIFCVAGFDSLLPPHIITLWCINRFVVCQFDISNIVVANHNVIGSILTQSAVSAGGSF
jgi:hypothetical protein